MEPCVGVTIDAVNAATEFLGHLSVVYDSQLPAHCNLTEALKITPLLNGVI